MTVTIKASDFTYPTIDERRKAIIEYPKLRTFDFPKITLNDLLDSTDFEKDNRTNNLYWWNDALRGRLWQLYQAYVNTMTHFNRGTFKEDSQLSDQNLTNKIQFDFYSEAFYYYFFSTRDIIAQIIKWYFRPDMLNKKVFYNDKFIESIHDAQVEDIIRFFLSRTKKACNIRNRFTHGFSPNRSDSRTILEYSDNKKILNFFSGVSINAKELVTNMNESLQYLDEFIDELRKNMD